MSRLHTMTDIIQKIVAMDKVENHRRRQNKRWLIALGAWLCRFIQVWENSTNNNNNTEAIIILSKSAAICSPSTNAWGEFVSAQCVCVVSPVAAGVGRRRRGSLRRPCSWSADVGRPGHPMRRRLLATARRSSARSWDRPVAASCTLGGSAGTHKHRDVNMTPYEKMCAEFYNFRLFTTETPKVLW